MKTAETPTITITSQRYLYWDENDQLQAMKDNNNSAYYLYDHAGERNWKIVGAKITATVNGVKRKYNIFNASTLYLFPEVTVTGQGYTKHIFAGTERICSKVGTGRSWATTQPSFPAMPNQSTINTKRTAQRTLIQKVFTNMCYYSINPGEIVMLCPMMDGANMMSANLLQSSLNSISTSTTATETIRYFYHTDHLGSTSFVSNAAGTPIQYLNYNPFGGIIQNQKATGSSYEAEFKFSGKLMDGETDFSYFGARYYDSGLGIWLSVDPLASKYPGLSPYVYCSNNPVNRIDPDGRADDWYLNLQKGQVEHIAGSDNHFDKGYVHLAGDNASFGDIADALTNQHFEYRTDPSVSGGFVVDTEKQYKGWAMMMQGDAMLTILGIGSLPSKLPNSKVGSSGMYNAGKMLTTKSLNPGLKYNQQQVWKKFGEHYKDLGLTHSKEGMQQYLKIAQDVYNSPAIKHTFPKSGYYKGETWMIKNGNILRLDQNGNFRSLYPIK